METRRQILDLLIEAQMFGAREAATVIADLVERGTLELDDLQESIDTHKGSARSILTGAGTSEADAARILIRLTDEGHVSKRRLKEAIEQDAREQSAEHRRRASMNDVLGLRERTT